MADLDILVIGSTHSFSEGGEAGVVHEKAFDPTAIATQLQSILAADSNIPETVNVVFEDVYRTKTLSTAIGSPLSYRTYEYRCYSLAQFFMWPEGKTDRMTNLRGANGTAWDYVILLEDPYVMANFPGMYAEGVKLIQSEVSQGTAQLILLGQWPENSSGFNATQFNEIVHRVGDSAGLSIVPAGKAWNSLPSQDSDAAHPTPKGRYLAAASIYSKITNRNASVSGYTFDDTIADHALSVVQAAAGVPQYSGTYISPNPFQMKYVRKRQLAYSERGSSTEDGIVLGLNNCFDVSRMSYSKVSALTAVDFHFSRGTDIFEPDKQYLVDPSYIDRSYGFPMQDNGNTGQVTMLYGIDKRYQGTTYRNGTDLGVAYSMILEGHVAPTYDVRIAPLRLMWSKMNHDNPSLVFPYRNATNDLWHLSNEMERAMAAFMLTLTTGRCPVDAEPADNTSLEWRRWYGRKIGYETAWQMSHITTRAPGFRVLPTAAANTVVSPATSETLSVQFMNAPTAGVTVHLSVDDPAAGTVSPSTLTFTPGNHAIAQTVTVSGALGSESGVIPFNVILTTTSDDEVYDGLTDSWDFLNELEFAQLSKTTATVAENGGTDTFTVQLSWPPATNVVVDLASSAPGDATVSPASLTFTSANWNTPQTVTLTGVNDDIIAPASATVTLSVNDAASDAAFDGQPDLNVAVTCTNDDSAGFTLSKNTSTVGENGGTDTFTVVLNAEPTSDVVLDVISSNALEATVSPAALTFAPGNWDSPQSVTLTGVDDFTLGNDAATVTIGIVPAASDHDFDAVADQTVSITCASDEVTGDSGSNTAPTVSPIANQAINLGAADPGAPDGEIELVRQDFGGNGAASLTVTPPEVYHSSLGGSGIWAGSSAINNAGYGRANNAKVTYLDLGSTINDAKGEADAKFELTATLTQPTEGNYNMFSFSNSAAPINESNASFVASIGYSRLGNVLLSTGPGLASTTIIPSFSGVRTFTIALDFSPAFYNGSTTFGRITWSDSVAGVLGTSDLTVDLGIQSIVLSLDATKSGVRTASFFSALTLTQSAASSTASTTLTGSAGDAENNPLTLAWSVVNKPAGSEVIFGNDAAISTGAVFSAAGTYTLRLTATDNWGASDSEDFTVTVVSADTAIVSVTANDAAASETGPDAGQWTITRTGSTDTALDVHFTLGGTATLTDDYSLSVSSPLTIPVGQSSAVVTLTPVDDSIVETGGETATLTLANDAAYAITSPSSAAITIADNDVAGPVVTTNHSVPHAWLSGINAGWASDYEAAALADHDLDGIPTWQEYWSGTDPEDRNSWFKLDSITLDGGDVVLEWKHAHVDPAIPDITIESSPDLTAQSWLPVATHTPVDGVNGKRIPASGTIRFYRLRSSGGP